MQYHIISQRKLKKAKDIIKNFGSERATATVSYSLQASDLCGGAWPHLQINLSGKSLSL
jgi:hypothetical protein